MECGPITVGFKIGPLVNPQSLVATTFHVVDAFWLVLTRSVIWMSWNLELYTRYIGPLGWPDISIASFSWKIAGRQLTLAYEYLVSTHNFSKNSLLSTIELHRSQINVVKHCRRHLLLGYKMHGFSWYWIFSMEVFLKELLQMMQQLRQTCSYHITTPDTERLRPTSILI